MSAARYPSSGHASPSHHGRPRSIAELAAIAQHNLWDPSKPLKHWLRTAEKARKLGQSYVDASNYEAAFIEFARAATIVLEKLPIHQEYNVLLNADQRANLAMNGQDILDGLSKLKPFLVERYETYRSTHGDDVPLHPPSEDAARRKRDAEEEERMRQALETAHLEDEWRRSDVARREAEDLQRRVQEERDWTRQAKEARLRDTSEAQRAAEAREAAEQERASSRYRVGEEARRSEDRRRLEQEGILQRQHEADVAARETRRQFASVSSILTPTKPASDTYYGRSQEPDTPTHTVPVATPPPPRPPSSQQQQQQQGSHYSSDPPSMFMEASAPYTDVAGSDTRNASWNRLRQPELTPTKPKHLG
ncbi:hypothetical protein PHLGIDRAFT_144740 [Phlebiopsis gigantea 11061_1 CR5-6]|uniref:USP8 dimerisation domain-containing protein n=1 Tax=Phlebiopsis gigantea (strain 11061_1 CR5-6) TaxID=745531 RepID=A0A0C3PI32_PHLG1|nr:hypothetical protein PHLGIDRAFT_144740 [Phlebiopsis gigantea 11061_1 CR5-6]